jgi:hypothetical protein
MGIDHDSDRSVFGIKQAISLAIGWASSILLLLCVGLPCSHFALASLLMLFSLKMEPWKLLTFTIHVLYAELSLCVLVLLALCIGGIIRRTSIVMLLVVTLSVLFVLPLCVAISMGLEDWRTLNYMRVLAASGLLILVDLPIAFHFIKSDVLLK